MKPLFSGVAAISIALLAVAACGPALAPGETTPMDNGKEVTDMEGAGLEEKVVDAAIADLIATHGEEQAKRIRTGVVQAAAMWRAEDGTSSDFMELCQQGFLVEAKDLDSLAGGFEDNLEQILGHLHEISRHLREPTDLDRGPVRPHDRMFAGYDLGAHVIDDMFRSKIAFLVLLNFEQSSLEEMLAEGSGWSRDDWTRARAAQMFSTRVPSDVEQLITEAFVSADSYISDYNIHMHHLVTPQGERLFPKGLVLISHWGLRDELKSHYGDSDGLRRQRAILEVMEKIISQEIPAAVIDNPHLDWVVETGEVRPTDSPDAAGGAYDHMKGIAASPQREQDTRYARLLEVFRAVRSADPYDPAMPTYIDRKFKRAREIPKEEVVRLLESVLTSDAVPDVAKLIEKRVGRKLEPFDIWYEGFRGRGEVSEEELDRMVSERYPTVEHFRKDIPTILEKLGFDSETAAFLGTKIEVDPARGAGHAMGAERREDKAHLRTRIPAGGMKYKGFNIAVHELGHNVEQVLSLNRIDHYLLNGVPNTAFTEGFAFAFQAHDLELLGVKQNDPLKDHLDALDALWQTYEIGGVAMVDIEVWDWMYAHPEATPAELRQAVVAIAKDVWNRYFAPVFGVKDQPILAVYSHMIDAGMYIPDYPIGGLIQFQVEAYFEKNGLAKEMERMCKIGSITPAAWMEQAVGGPISAGPMIDAAREAVKAVE